LDGGGRSFFEPDLNANFIAIFDRYRIRSAIEEEFISGDGTSRQLDVKLPTRRSEFTPVSLHSVFSFTSWGPQFHLTPTIFFFFPVFVPTIYHFLFITTTTTTFFSPFVVGERMT
jgi:hypothetical protein